MNSLTGVVAAADECPACRTLDNAGRVELHPVPMQLYVLRSFGCVLARR